MVEENGQTDDYWHITNMFYQQIKYALSISLKLQKNLKKTSKKPLHSIPLL